MLIGIWTHDTGMALHTYIHTYIRTYVYVRTYVVRTHARTHAHTKYWQIVTAHSLPKDLVSNQPKLSSNRALCCLIMLMVLAVNVEDVCTHHLLNLVNAEEHIFLHIILNKICNNG